MAVALSGSIILEGSITGSLLGTASYSSNTELFDGLDSSVFALTSSLSAFSSSLNGFTSSINTYTSSNNSSISNLNGATSSLFAATSSLFTYTASATSRINALDQYTASLNTRSASFACVNATNTFACAQYFSDASNASNFNSTSSLYSDGGMRITKDLYVSGTSYFNNITVFGTQSVAYISSSQLNIGTNIISVNTDVPAIRFGGLAVYDSGSTGLTGSILWDSQANHWVYSNPSGSTYSGGMFISGPRSAALGSEQGTTACRLLVGQGGDHLTSSMIYHDSTVTCIPNTLIGDVSCFATSCATSFIGGTLSGTTIYGSTAVCSANGLLIGNGGVTATCNYLPKFTGASTIGNSSILDNGTGRVSIGTTSFLDSFVISNSGAAGWEFSNLGSVITYNRSTSAYIPMTFEASNYILNRGNLGLGVTPSAGWVQGKALEVGFVGTSLWGRYANEAHFTMNYYYSTSANARVYASTNAASDYEQYNGQHVWYSAPSGTAGCTISFTQAMTLDACGRLGIGITSPLAKLDILGNTDTYAGMAKIYLTDSNTNSNSRNWSIGNGGSAYGNLTFSVSAAKNGNAGDGTSINAMVINNTGNVGIGTTSPAAALQVVDSQRALAVYRISGTNRTTFYDNSFAVCNDGGGADGFIYGSNTGGSFPFNGYGEVIIQANPRTGYQNGISFVTGTTSPTVKMRILENGNVGIGTTDPGQKLEVVGGEIKAGRVDSSNEGGQVSFGRASDNATGWYIDAYGSTSTPSLRFVDVSNSSVRMNIDGSGNVTTAASVDAGTGFGTVVAYVNVGTTGINCDLAASLSDGTYLINAFMVRGGAGINQTYSATWLYHHYSNTAGTDVINALVAPNSPNNNNGLISLTGTTVCIGWGGSRGPASLTAMRIRFAP